MILRCRRHALKHGFDSFNSFRKIFSSLLNFFYNNLYFTFFLKLFHDSGLSVKLIFRDCINHIYKKL